MILRSHTQFYFVGLLLKHFQLLVIKKAVAKYIFVVCNPCEVIPLYSLRKSALSAELKMRVQCGCPLPRGPDRAAPCSLSLQKRLNVPPAAVATGDSAAVAETAPHHPKRPATPPGVCPETPVWAGRVACQ